MIEPPTPFETNASSGWPRARAAGLSFRPADATDAAFLLRLYASTRIDELNWLQWTDRQKTAFIDLQARAQQAEYARNYPEAERLIIERQGEPIGRLFLHRSAIGLHVIDMSLLPGVRRRGLGTAILSDVIEGANAIPVPVTIHVEKSNPAADLYRRMGFVTVADKGVYNLMQLPAGARPSGGL